MFTVWTVAAIQALQLAVNAGVFTITLHGTTSDALSVM